jgi:glycosyltransferase involved in cell wall biosynthesis
MKKKIVLINQVTGYLFIDVVNAFAKEYDEVILMAGDIIPMSVPLDESVKVQKISKYGRKNAFNRFTSWIFAFFQIFFLLLFKYKSHELFISSNPPISSTLLPFFFRNRKIHLLIYDIYPEGLEVGGFVTKKNWIFKCWRWLNLKAYKKVHAVITLTDGMANALKTYSPNVVVIPAWSSSIGEFRRIATSKNKFIEKYNLQDKFIVVYSGNLGKEYALESIVYLAEKFVHVREIMFVIVGNGWKKEILQKLVSEKKLDNCKILPYQDADLFIHSLSAFDVGIVSLPSALSKVAIPSKTYNLLAAHRPILCVGSEDSDLADFLRRNEIGLTFESDKIEEMKDFITKMHAEKAFFNRICENAAGVSRYYTRERAKDIVALIKRT